MNFKRALAVGAAVMMMVTGSVTALAHHGGGGHCGQRRTVTYQVCTYADCVNTERHTHNNDGCYYYGHYDGDGHAHCTASNTAACGGYYCH